VQHHTRLEMTGTNGKVSAGDARRSLELLSARMIGLVWKMLGFKEHEELTPVACWVD
jgi:hypothetical protein